jgi:very-short-patch-repair endonuclease
MRAKIITLKRARKLRGAMTESEVRLWARLRRRSADWPIFRRQHPMGAYILDFYCPSARLAVEVDGLVHAEAAQVEHDQRRDRWLNNEGVTVHRVSAMSAFERPDAVADAVRRLAMDIMLHRKFARGR